MDKDAKIEVGQKSADLLEELLRISQLVRMRFNDWLAEFELNDGRYGVLVALARGDAAGCSQTQLAERLGQSESNVSTLIERMQRDGLVQRSQSQSDRRKRIIQITVLGQSLIASVDSRRGMIAGKLFQGLAVSEREQLLVLMTRLGTQLVPDRECGINPQKTTLASSDKVLSPVIDPSEDPESPQFALRQMLKSLSTLVDVESAGKDAA